MSKNTVKTFMQYAERDEEIVDTTLKMPAVSL